MENQIIDRAALMDSIQDDRELLSDLVELFDEYYPRTLAKLSTAVGEKDSSKIREVSHKLKGSVSNFHAIEARKTAFELERKGREQDFENVDALANQLGGELLQLSNHLQEILASTEA